MKIRAVQQGGHIPPALPDKVQILIAAEQYIALQVGDDGAHLIFPGRVGAGAEDDTVAVDVGIVTALGQSKGLIPTIVGVDGEGAVGLLVPAAVKIAHTVLI